MPHPSGRPWIIAHRGASLRAPENTLAAFRLAAELGADAVELDVRMTADGLLVVHHDDTLAGRDRPISAMLRAEIRETAPDVPDLDAALDVCRPMWVDVEIKNDPRDADWDEERRIAHQMTEACAGHDVVVTSFDPVSVEIAAAAGLRTGLLLARGVDPATAAGLAADAGHRFLLPHHSTLAGAAGPHIIAAARAAEIEVAVWTVDEPDDIARLAALGVGGIATNAPDVAASVLVEYGNGEGR
jgi:glycerophosphoryl diester phosphodiesterase